MRDALARYYGEPRADWDDRAWRVRKIGRAQPSVLRAVEAVYTAGRADSRYTANQGVLAAADALAEARTLPLPLDADADEISAAATKLADRCLAGPQGRRRRAVHAARNIVPAVHVEHARALCERLGIRSASWARMICPIWWRRQLRRRLGRVAEHAARRLGIVQASAECYASDWAVERRRSQDRAIAAWLADRDLICTAGLDAGTVVDMAPVVASSLAHPAKRYAECMVRVAGAQDYADASQHAAHFVTVTCPSRFHSHHRGGGANPRYAGGTPRDAQAYLCRVWARTRALWAAGGLGLYGLRVAEPHHDGCPHWHVLIFGAPDAAAAGIAALRAQALADSPDEPGADTARFKAVTINRAQGSAAGYVAKYLAKGLTTDGAMTDRDCDWYGNDAATAVERIRAWATLWGIRQYQFFGLPAVGPWRELRRLRDGMPGGEHAAAWAAADAGDWGAYMVAQRRAPVGLWREWDARPGRYGDPRGWRTRGIACAGQEFATRVNSWRAAAKVGGGLHPRIGGTNCKTQPIGVNRNENAIYGGSSRSGPTCDPRGPVRARGVAGKNRPNGHGSMVSPDRSDNHRGP